MGKIVEIKMYINEDIDVNSLINETEGMKVIKTSESELGENENKLTEELINRNIDLCNYSAGKLTADATKALDTNLTEVIKLTESLFNSVSINNINKVVSALIKCEIIKGEWYNDEWSSNEYVKNR